MKLKNILLALALVSTVATACKGNKQAEEADEPEVIVGAAQTEKYLPLLKGKKVALFSNHTGMVDDKHTLDILLENGIDVVAIFSPEHGFRGDADAGEHVSSGVDEKTGVPIASLYDRNRRGPNQELIDSLDVIVSDIQDVGLRYYTYYATMIKLMEIAAANGKEFLILDRPNPNGMYVDGPILDMKYRSGVGRLPIPVVHGMTLGELGIMANEMGWLDDSVKVESLTVVPVENYTHSTRYELPIAPSPNLRDMKAIYLYPATCYFEATPVSLGRGTDFPFLVYGHPDMKGEGHEFEFTPVSSYGAKEPPLQDQLCYGVDLREISDDDAIAQGVTMAYVIDAYNTLGMGDEFFRNNFEKLIGRGDIRQMIEDGKSAEEIKATWADDVAKFKEQRKPFLLYEE